MTIHYFPNKAETAFLWHFVIELHWIPLTSNSGYKEPPVVYKLIYSQHPFARRSFFCIFSLIVNTKAGPGIKMTL